jgi:hypothetical protein
VARDLRPTLAVRFVQLSELFFERERVGKRRKESARQRRFVRSRRKKKLFFFDMFESRKISENETKRATALKTKRPFSTERRPTGETETDGRR